MALGALDYFVKPVDGKRLVERLRRLKLKPDKADAIAVRLDELIRSIKDTVGSTITAESDLTVEISGGITLSAQGSAKWLFFNIGGGAKTTDTLKVVFKTKLQPQGTKTTGSGSTSGG